MFHKVNCHIKLAGLHKQKKTTLLLNKASEALLRKYVVLGVIECFEKKGAHITIHTSFKNGTCVFKGIKNYYRSSSKKHIRLTELKKLSEKRNLLLIISTSYGILTSYEAIQKKTGGILISAIYA